MYFIKIISKDDIESAQKNCFLNENGLCIIFFLNNYFKIIYIFVYCIYF